MRNLKKVLAVGLALVMALSLAISAGAFTDDADITHPDAVNLLTQLGVINGFTDGSFRPDGNVTRAQMAKMIYVAIRTMDDNATNFVNANTGLTDLGLAVWAKGYVNFAFASDIVNGYTDSSFRPNNNVTGYEAAKMLLTMLGYSTAIEGYTGTGWDFNVAVDAATAGLLDGLETIDLSMPLNRDNAAQMIYNAFFAMPVTYPNGVLTMGEDEYAVAKFGLVKETGILVANDYANLAGPDALADGMSGLFVDYDDDGYIHSGDEYVEEFDIASDASLLGCSVVFYTNADGVGYGMVADSGDNMTYTYTDATSFEDAADDAGFDGMDSDWIEFGNYDRWWESSDGVIGATTTLIDNDNDGDVDVVMQVYYEFSNVSEKTDDTITLDYFGELDADEVVGFDDVEEGDYVNVMENTDEGMYYVMKAESMVAQASSFNSSTVKIDGTTYKMSEMYNNTSLDDIDEIAVGDLNADATFYFDANGYPVAFGDVAGPETMYAFLYAYSTTAANAVTEEDASGWVRLGFLDGTMGVYEVDADTAVSLNSQGLTYDTAFANEIVEYSITDGVVTSIDVTPTGLVTDTAITIADGTITLLDTVPDPDAVIAGTYLGNATAFFYGLGSTTANADAYVGYKNLPTTATGAVEYIMDGSAVVIIAIDDAGTTTTAGSYAYCLSTTDPLVTADGTVYPFAIDGVEVELTLDGVTPTYGHVYTYTSDADGIVTALSDKSAAPGTVDLVYADDGLVVIDGDVYTYDADMVYDVTDGVAMGDLAADQNVLFVASDSDILVMYIVD